MVNFFIKSHSRAKLLWLILAGLASLLFFYWLMRPSESRSSVLRTIEPSGAIQHPSSQSGAKSMDPTTPEWPLVAKGNGLFDVAFPGGQVVPCSELRNTSLLFEDPEVAKVLNSELGFARETRYGDLHILLNDQKEIVYARCPRNRKYHIKPGIDQALLQMSKHVFFPSRLHEPLDASTRELPFVRELRHGRGIPLADKRKVAILLRWVQLWKHPDGVENAAREAWVLVAPNGENWHKGCSPWEDEEEPPCNQALLTYHTDGTSNTAPWFGHEDRRGLAQLDTDIFGCWELRGLRDKPAPGQPPCNEDPRYRETETYDPWVVCPISKEESARRLADASARRTHPMLHRD